jgi:hypothetical protein
MDMDWRDWLFSIGLGLMVVAPFAITVLIVWYAAYVQ